MRKPFESLLLMLLSVVLVAQLLPATAKAEAVGNNGEAEIVPDVIAREETDKNGEEGTRGNEGLAGSASAEEGIRQGTLDNAEEETEVEGVDVPAGEKDAESVNQDEDTSLESPGEDGKHAEGEESELDAQATPESGRFYGMEWRITSSGALILGRAGKKQTLDVTNKKDDERWPWQQNIDITSVRVEGAVEAKGSLKDMFSNCALVESMNLSGLFTSDVTNMHGMFASCHSLRSLDLSSWDTSSVTDMMFMFSGCTSLFKLNISGWDTSNVTNIASMFSNCQMLEEIDVSDWDTSSINSYGMIFVFDGCKSLKSIDVSKWDVSSVTVMEGVFQDCSSLRSLSLLGWNTLAVKGTLAMFDGCRSLCRVVHGPLSGRVGELPAQEISGGKWHLEGTDQWLTPEEIVSRGMSLAVYTCAENPFVNATIEKIPDQIYVGESIKPRLTVSVGETTLKEGTDYEATFFDNFWAGTATVVVHGKGAYAGTKRTTFKIVDPGRYKSPFTDVSGYTSHCPEINWLADVGISTGWTEKNGTRTFRPDSNVKRGDMAAFLFRLANRWNLVDDSWQPTGAITFVDVSESTSHCREILWLAEAGISTGWSTEAGKEFRPFERVKRGDMAAFMYRLAKKAGRMGGKASSRTFFEDVTTSTSFHDEIWWLAGNGVTQGWAVPYLGANAREYRPNLAVKRGDMAAFLYRLDGVS